MLQVAVQESDAESTGEGASCQDLRMVSGERVLLEDRCTGQRLRLLAANGELLFEYDPVACTTRLAIPEGDLQLATPRGAISLAGARGVHLSSPSRVQIAGDEGVEMAATPETSVWLRPRSLSLRSPRARLAARRMDIRAELLGVAGRRLRAGLAEADIALGKLHSVAESIFQRAKNIFQSVEGLVQTRARRARTVVEESAYLQGRDLYIRAERDTNIDGTQINLG